MLTQGEGGEEMGTEDLIMSLFEKCRLGVGCGGSKWGGGESMQKGKWHRSGPKCKKGGGFFLAGEKNEGGGGEDEDLVRLHIGKTRYDEVV